MKLFAKTISDSKKRKRTDHSRNGSPTRRLLELTPDSILRSALDPQDREEHAREDSIIALHL